MNDFQSVTRLQWVKRSIGKALYVQILLILTEGNFIESIIDISIWNLNMYINHTSFNEGFIVNKSWRLFQMPWFSFSKIYCLVSGHRLCKSLVSPPQCPTPRAPSVCPTRHFPAAGSRASERELLLTCPTPSRRTVEMHGLVLIIQCLYGIFEHESC